MIACVDVDYRDTGAVAACVCFEHWDDGTPVLESAIEIADVEPYEPGQFYRRELPCILAVLQSLPTITPAPHDRGSTGRSLNQPISSHRSLVALSRLLRA